jgi:hypothetical protein
MPVAEKLPFVLLGPLSVHVIVASTATADAAIA